MVGCSKAGFLNLLAMHCNKDHKASWLVTGQRRSSATFCSWNPTQEHPQSRSTRCCRNPNSTTSASFSSFEHLTLLICKSPTQLQVCESWVRAARGSSSCCWLGRSWDSPQPPLFDPRSRRKGLIQLFATSFVVGCTHVLETQRLTTIRFGPPGQAMVCKEP